MYFGLVYFPIIENDGFHTLRQEYDPFAAIFPVHITFIYPLPESIGKENLENHIKNILKDWQPFNILFNKIEVTLDHWLFLGAESGKDMAIQLHDELYSGILSQFLRKDLPYLPRLGLGLFSREKYDIKNPSAELTLDIDQYSKARKRFETLNFEFQCTIDQLTLLGIHKDFTTYDEIAICKLV